MMTQNFVKTTRTVFILLLLAGLLMNGTQAIELVKAILLSVIWMVTQAFEFVMQMFRSVISVF